MRSRKKSAAFAALLIASFVLVGAACGDSSSTTDASSTTTAKSSGSGSDATICADLFNQVEDLVATMDASDTGTTDKMSPDMSQTMKSLESFSSSVPSEIREDWKTVISAIKSYVEELAGIDFANPADPTTEAKLAKAESVMDDAKYQRASENLDQWIQKNCPSYANE
ncbi:MAG: hypothetical protein K9H34_08190 [Actinomycetia bacterium]|nr:hypothetical protein [Actinomycetes bacterium]